VRHHFSFVVLGIAILSATPLMGRAQQNSAQNSGDCVILVQGNNNTVSLSGQCTPRSGSTFKEALQTENKNKDMSGKLAFIIDEFYIDGPRQTVIVSMSARNTLDYNIGLQLVTLSLLLSAPPVSNVITNTEGISRCNFVGGDVMKACLGNANLSNLTNVPKGSSAVFRITGRYLGGIGAPPSKGALSLVLVEKSVEGPSKRLDVSFLDVRP
jgi:hypothetical protein